MEKLDKAKIHESINEAYENQTDKVKELLQSAKENLADLKECPYDYVAKKEKVKQFHSISRVVTKKKQNENRIEKDIHEQFTQMNQKLDINSKNLDFIFKNVAENNQTEIVLLQNVMEEQKQLISKLIYSIRQLEKKNTKNHVSIMQKAEDMQKGMKQTQTEIFEKVVQKQNELEGNVENIQLNIQKKVLEMKEKVTTDLLDSNQNIQNNILKEQKEVTRKIINIEAQMEQKINELQKNHELNLMKTKEDLEQIYKQENKHAITALLAERNTYLKELEDKDQEIKQLNYRINQYEEKLEKEIEKRKKQSIWNIIFQKMNSEEEPIQYTTQILNGIY